MLDLVTVLLPLWDVIVTGDLAYVSSLCYLRIMRVFRIMVSYEFFRVPLFAQLRILITALLLSVPTFLWAAMIAALFVYSFGVAIVLGLAWRLQEAPDDTGSAVLSDNSDAIVFFGGVGPACLYLLMSLTNGIDWEAVYYSLNNFHFLYRGGYLFYIIFMFIAVLNIVGGIFIARAFDVVHRDSDWLFHEEQVHKRVFEKRVQGLLHQIGKDMSGDVRWADFQAAMNDPHVESYLNFMELDVESLRSILDLFQSDDSETINMDQLLEGLYRLKGSARKSQVRLMQEQLRRLSAAQVIPSTTATS